MAFFGSTNAFLGLDIGTSSLKLVELIDRKKRIELSTYAQANLPNPLIAETGNVNEGVKIVANTLSSMIDKAGVTTDAVVAALPCTIVFSTVLTLPDLPQEEMDKAVRFAARDVVPSDLSEMVLGWSKVVSDSHMETDGDKAAQNTVKKNIGLPTTTKVPVFLTAAPKAIVDRYVQVLAVLKLKVFALEVETFPLARSLLGSNQDSALIVDMGDLATTYHIIDKGTPRVSHTIDYGGHHITLAIAKSLNISEAEAEQKKISVGLDVAAPENVRKAIQGAISVQIEKAKTLLQLYQQKEKHIIGKTILIGGGANLRELQSYWSSEVGQKTAVGNPWKGLAYPKELESRLELLGPTYGVAVGLALRGLQREAF